jgi:hypothetical protein
LGQQLSVAFSELNFTNSDAVDIAGPIKMGEVVRAEITRKERHHLVGQILDGEGNPLANQSVKISAKRQRQDAYSNTSSLVKTNQEGRFRYVVSDHKPPPRFFDQGVEEEVKANPLESIRILYTAENSQQSEGEALVSLPAEPQDVDVGVVRLLEKEAALLGRVVDHLGEPLGQVTVQVRKELDEDGRRVRRSYVRDWSTYTDKDGRFAFYGAAESGYIYKLEMRRQGFEEVSQDVLLSPEEQVFEMSKAPAIFAEILTDKNVIQADIDFDIEYENDSGGRARYGQAPSGEQGRIQMTIAGVSGQPFTFQIKTTSGSVLYQSGEMVMAAGDELRPPELNPLDLRGKLTAFSITSVDADGNGVPARVRATDDGERLDSMGWDSGEARFVTLGPVDSMVVRAKGYFEEKLTDVHEDQEVVMRKMIRAFVQFPDEFKQYRDGIVTFDSGFYYDEFGNHKRLEDAKPDEDGRVELFFPEPGEYQVDLRYTPRFGSSRLQRTSRSHSEQTVRLHTDGQTVMLIVDREELDQAVEKFIEKSKENQ